MKMARSPEQVRHDLLVLRSQSGDRNAINDLVGIWQTRLWRVALAKLDDEEAAWDVVQDAWLIILRKFRQLRQPEAFGGWAMQIVANAAKAHLRRNSRHARAIHALPVRSVQAPKESASIDGRLLASLPEAQFQALILYYWEHMSIPEIAETLGVPVGTIKSRLHYARQNFKQLLGDDS